MVEGLRRDYASIPEHEKGPAADLAIAKFEAEKVVFINILRIAQLMWYIYLYLFIFF